GSEAAMRVVSLKPRAANASAPGSKRPTASTSAHAATCGRWLMAATVRSWVSGATALTRAPSASHSALTPLIARGSVASVGVTMTVVPRNSIARATRQPLFSGPALGWLPAHAAARARRQGDGAAQEPDADGDQPADLAGAFPSTVWRAFTSRRFSSGVPTVTRRAGSIPNGVIGRTITPSLSKRW